MRNFAYLNVSLSFLIGLFILSNNAHSNDKIKALNNCVLPQNDSMPELKFSCEEIYKSLEKSISFNNIKLSNYPSDLIIIKEYVRDSDSIRNLEVIKGEFYANQFYNEIKKSPLIIIPDRFRTDFEYEIYYLIDVRMEYEMKLRILWTLRKIKKPNR